MVKISLKKSVIIFFFNSIFDYIAFVLNFINKPERATMFLGLIYKLQIN